MASSGTAAELSQPSYGYAVLAVFLAFSVFSARQLAWAVLVLAAAFISRPDNK
jgi:hypothetical protein